MPTPTKGPRLGGGPAHERLILANLATSLFEHGRITTTEAKAKRLRPLAERLITFAERNGGYTRITKIGPRKGDNAPRAVIEIVREPLSPKQAVVKEATKATAKAAPKAEKVEDAKVEETVAEDVVEDAPVADEAPAEDKADDKA